MPRVSEEDWWGRNAICESSPHRPARQDISPTNRDGSVPTALIPEVFCYEATEPSSLRLLVDFL